MWATPGQRGFPKSNASTQLATVAGSRMATVVPTPLSQHVADPHQTAAQQEAIRKQREALQKSAELRQLLASLEKVNDEGRRSSLLDSLCSNEDILNLPLYPNPPGIASGELTVDLLRHQVRVIRFLTEPQLTLYCCNWKASSPSMVYRTRESVFA